MIKKHSNIINSKSCKQKNINFQNRNFPKILIFLSKFMDFAIIINCKIIFYFIIYVNKIFFNEKYFFTVEK